MRPMVYGAIVEMSSALENKTDRHITKEMADRKILSEGRQKSFMHCQWTSFEIDINFCQQLWGEREVLGGLFHKNGG